MQSPRCPANLIIVARSAASFVSLQSHGLLEPGHAVATRSLSFDNHKGPAWFQDRFNSCRLVESGFSKLENNRWSCPAAVTIHHLHSAHSHWLPFARMRRTNIISILYFFTSLDRSPPRSSCQSSDERGACSEIFIAVAIRAAHSRGCRPGSPIRSYDRDPNRAERERRPNRFCVPRKSRVGNRPIQDRHLLQSHHHRSCRGCARTPPFLRREAS